MSFLSRIGTSFLIYTAKRTLFHKQTEYKNPYNYTTRQTVKSVPYYNVSKNQTYNLLLAEKFSDAIGIAKRCAKQYGGYYTICKVFSEGNFVGYGFWSERNKCLTARRVSNFL